MPGVILFGNGANNGNFGRLRGGGVKGPVLELRRRLAEQMVVIDCDEYRTSKLCLDCGRVAKTPKKKSDGGIMYDMYGVTYCSDRRLHSTVDRPRHHRMEDRDIAAAFKIGARYLATKRYLDLGPWKRGSVLNDRPRRIHTVLRDVLTAYQQEYMV
jgi:hypothetical protein